MPSYKKKLKMPVWGLYFKDELIATIREDKKEIAEAKLSVMVPEDRRDDYQIKEVNNDKRGMATEGD
jgi:hypothetical protein